MKTFTDDRGTIEDLKVGKDWSVTYISFKKGSVRGNHVHYETDQMDFILKGKLECAQGFYSDTKILEKGDFIFQPNHCSHAYKALKNSEIISICFGKRIGENYESDTYGLTGKDKLL